MAIFENIKLEKGLYTTGKSFTKTLEELDPSENYIGTSLDGLDAYQRQLKRFDIKVGGAGSDMIEKFFKTSDSAVLFPEYVSRAVYQGIKENDILPKLVATVTDINGMDYRTIASIPSDTDLEMPIVAEGESVPETTVKVQDNLVKLKKRGRTLVASYEAIRFQRLDLFTVTLKQIGAYIAKTQLKDAINVLMNGDGNDNEISKSYVATAGQLNYEDLISFWNKFDPYNLNTIIASPDTAAKLLSLPEFRDATAGMNFHATGKLVTPFGAELFKSSAVDEKTLIGIDRTCALEQVQAGGVTTEFDKLIDRQLERAVITTISGFAKIYADASKALSLGSAGGNV
ncbi:MAG: phage major capsid protein [Faecalibacterium sp.]|nr:phage major capsid protein [Ruminococcus sp.]MCM1392674.1 phage major capsid protein [Ruminococcus sp.]MCM1486342.1 phage major capsid protein [Faecalibacterium sp.]